MNGGDLRRENHNLAPTSISNPLQVKWVSSACSDITVPAGGPVVLADRVIQCFVHGVRCVDRATGNPLWTWPCQDTELYYTPAYDADRDVLYVCLKASDGSCVWHVYKQCWRQNALLLSDNYFYAMNNQADLECRNRTDGSLVWSTTLTGTTDGNLAICGTLLIVPGDSWRIWGIDMYTGAKVWCTRLSGNFARNTPFVACGKVYISACHGDYYGLDGQTGNIEWQYHHGVEYTFVDWAEADGNLFVACRDGRIFCFDSVTPGNPANCVCNLNSTPLPTLTPTPTFTLTYTPSTTTTPGCAGGICLVSD